MKFPGSPSKAVSNDVAHQQGLEVRRKEKANNNKKKETAWVVMVALTDPKLTDDSPQPEGTPS